MYSKQIGIPVHLYVKWSYGRNIYTLLFDSHVFFFVTFPYLHMISFDRTGQLFQHVFNTAPLLPSVIWNRIIVATYLPNRKRYLFYPAPTGVPT